MDQTQPTDNQVLDQATNDDLQKAIDDITNTTNVDPVFSDPVAAPSSVPEGDTGELDESVGPFPAPKPEVKIPAPDPINLAPAPAPEPINIPTPAPEPATMPTPEPISEPVPEPEPTPAPDQTPEQPQDALSMRQVKEAALRDLVPLLGHLDMGPTQKFDLYRDIFKELKDYTILDPAYHAATEIPDEKARAEALLFLVESIDKM